MITLYVFSIVLTITLVCWHSFILKASQNKHEILVLRLSEQIKNQQEKKAYLDKQNSNYHLKNINFKLSVILNQLRVLEEISNAK